MRSGLLRIVLALIVSKIAHDAAMFFTDKAERFEVRIGSVEIIFENLEK